MVKQWWKYLAALVAVAWIVGPALAGKAYGQRPAAARTIKIGVMAALSGTGAASGNDMVNGWKLYWQQHGLTLAGHPIQMFYEDDAGDPNTAITKARLLVTGDHVDMLVGNLFASTGLAVTGYVKDTGTPYFIPVVSADNLTQRERIPNVVRVAGWSSSQTTHALGVWAAQHHYKRVVTIGQDYAFGWESVGGFVQTFTQNGGKVIDQQWNPIGTPDFSSYLAHIQSENPDLVFATETGADSVRFVQAWTSFGLKGKIALMGQEPLLDQSLLRTMGPDALDLISVGHYADGRNDKDTQAFVKTFESARAQIPSYYAAAMYTAAEWIASAIKKVHGNVQNRSAFLKAVKAVHLSHTPFGPESLDKYGNPVMNVYVRKVEKRKSDGKLWNVPIYTYKKVSQFWTYDPKKYLKQPVYSRSFQGNNVHP